MANSVFPDPDSAAGVVFRDPAGVALDPPEVNNAYSPAPPFIITCPPTALPSNCDARIEPRQINAIVSELLSFAECLDPDGPWDCNSLQNLCAAFAVWAAKNVSVAIISDEPPVGDPDPLKPGQFWFESDTGFLYIWFDDGSSTQWVQVGGNNSGVADGVSIVGVGTQVDPFTVGLVDCGTY